MATMSVNGFEGVNVSFNALLQGGKALATDMLTAEAEIVQAKQKSVGRQMGVYDPSSSVHTVEKVTHGNVVKKDDEYRMFVYPQGSRTRGNTTTRNAEIAFINEYGKTGQAARPWITTANAQAEEKALDAAEDVYDKFLKENDLI